MTGPVEQAMLQIAEVHAALVPANLCLLLDAWGRMMTSDSGLPPGDPPEKLAKRLARHNSLDALAEGLMWKGKPRDLFDVHASMRILLGRIREEAIHPMVPAQGVPLVCLAVRMWRCDYRSAASMWKEAQLAQGLRG